MQETDVIKALMELSQSIIFLYLFIRERNYTRELTDNRVNDYRTWQGQLMEFILRVEQKSVNGGVKGP